MDAVYCHLVASLLRTLGTPDDTVWPGFSQLPDYKDKFPKWDKQDIVSVIGDLEVEGQNLLRVSKFTLKLYLV